MPTLPLLFGCSAPRLPDPVVDEVVPSFAWNGEDVPVTVVGENFFPQVVVDAGGGRPEVDRSYRAWLVGPGGATAREELVGVGIVDDRHLSATVPMGLPSGEYELRVEGPTGATGRLDAPFVVTDAQAAQLVLDSAEVVYQVPEVAPVTITLVDLDGNTVPVTFEIAVTATAPSGQDPVFLPGTLVAAEPTPDGDGLRGFLDAGQATVFLSPGAPDLFTVTVAPWTDASVVGDTFALEFEPGEDLVVALRLPASGGGVPEYVAGEPVPVEGQLVDQYGNPVDQRIRVTLLTTCSGWLEQVLLDGPTTFDVVPTIASSAQCTEDRVEVFLGPAGQSDPFTVKAAPADHFDVFVVGGEVQAGDVVTVIVYPEDPFGNAALWEGALTLADSAGGLVEPSCEASPTIQLCFARLTRADPADVIEVTADGGIAGTSAPIVVVADDVPATLVATGPAVATAGTPFPVELRGYDAWGNPMDAALAGPEAFALSDDLGELACAFSSFLPDGAAAFDCTLFTARVGAVLTAEIPAYGLIVPTAPFEVQNGPIAVVTFDGEAPVTAGQVIALTLTATDAWGNPYVVQADPFVELADDTKTFSVDTAQLGSSGTAVVGGSFTAAGATVVHASQGGQPLGDSAPILVLPGTTTGLAITPLAPWAWEDVPTDVRVETVDAFGNRTDQGGSATLTSATTASVPVVVPLVNGVGTGSFTWVSPAFADRLDGAMTSFVGSADVVVATACGASGPVASMDFGGFAEAIACLDPASEAATVIADLSGSVAGAAPVVGWAAAREDGPTVWDTQPLLELTLPGAGAHVLYGLAVDDVGCGAEVAASGWAGPDDDTPTGPVALTTAATELPVFGSITVDVAGVVDCSRDPASLQAVRVRTTAGTLSGPVPTGAGAELLLDVNGDGTMTLQTAGALEAGTAEVHAWVPGGAAGGVLLLPVTGDNVRPIVVGQDPAGASSVATSEVTLSFSEPLLGTSVVPANFSVTGPGAVSVVSSAPAGNDVVLTLDVPADGALGVWTVVATGNVRDVAGNRLAGDWGPGAAPYAGGFGGSAALPEAASCVAFDPPGLAFRPDGDPGADAEADAIAVSVSSAQAPAWWVLEVTDDAGALVFQDWFVPVGAADTLSWGGRGFDGTVAPNGAWHLSVAPDDGLGNRGPGCAVTVTIDNALGAP